MVASDKDTDEFDDFGSPFGDDEQAQPAQIEETQSSSEEFEGDAFDSELADIDSAASVVDDPFMDDLDDDLDDFAGDDFSDDAYAAGDFNDDFGGGDDFSDDGGFDDGGFEDSTDNPVSGGGFDPKEFLKSNFQYIAFGVIGIIGVYVVFSTLASGDGSGQQSAGYEQPAIEQIETNQADNNSNRIAPFGSTPPQNNSAQQTQARPQGLLLGGNIPSSNNARQQQPQPQPTQQQAQPVQPQQNASEKQAELPRKTLQQRLGSSSSETQTTSSNSSRSWQQPPMPTPISKDVAPDERVNSFGSSRSATPSIPDSQPSKEIMATGSSAERLQGQSRSVVQDDTKNEQTSFLSNAREDVSSPVSDEKTSQLEKRISDLDRELKGVKSGYDSLSSKIDRMNERLANAVSSTGGQSSSNGDAVAKFEDNVARLEQKISKLEKELEQKSQEIDEAKSAALNTRSVDPSTVSKNQKRSVNRASVKRHAPSYVAPSVLDKKPATYGRRSVVNRTSSDYGVTIASPAQDPAFTEEQGWVLRAAQPGVAWVSRGYDAPIKKIFSGQVLSDIGTVKSIRLENGRWIVRGSQGQISQ